MRRTATIKRKCFSKLLRLLLINMFFAANTRKDICMRWLWYFIQVVVVVLNIRHNASHTFNRDIKKNINKVRILNRLLEFVTPIGVIFDAWYFKTKLEFYGKIRNLNNNLPSSRFQINKFVRGYRITLVAFLISDAIWNSYSKYDNLYHFMRGGLDSIQLNIINLYLCEWFELILILTSCVESNYCIYKKYNEANIPLNVNVSISRTIQTHNSIYSLLHEIEAYYRRIVTLSVALYNFKLFYTSYKLLNDYATTGIFRGVHLVKLIYYIWHLAFYLVPDYLLNGSVNRLEEELRRVQKKCSNVSVLKMINFFVLQSLLQPLKVSLATIHLNVAYLFVLFASISSFLVVVIPMELNV